MSETEQKRQEAQAARARLTGTVGELSAQLTCPVASSVAGTPSMRTVA